VHTAYLAPSLLTTAGFVFLFEKKAQRVWSIAIIAGGDIAGINPISRNVTSREGTPVDCSS